MKTYKKWSKSKKSFREYVEKGDKIDDEIFYHFLGCVPPTEQDKTGFLCGEPYTHNNKGEGVYDSFYCIAKKYIYGGLKTVKQFSDKEEAQ